MNYKILTKEQLKNRAYWFEEIIKLSGNFGADAEKVEDEISAEIKRDGKETLIGHLRLCGAIPEGYKHDSSEEKLYSKYTDIVLSKSFEAMGLASIVLTERGDAADVECVADEYSFVADAKAFRLSRTAKNQKDFKVQAMDNWKHGKPYAMVVCPIYQMPAKTSQIYLQAITRSVCIFSYTHLAVLIRYADRVSHKAAQNLLLDIFKQIEILNPSKDSVTYWASINKLMVGHGECVKELWSEEKKASAESIVHAKEEALTYLAGERERIMRLSKSDAVREILGKYNITNRENVINRVSDNGLLNAE